jgi:molybdopterin/thiamine biosynthesis adenylyltransferase
MPSLKKEAVFKRLEGIFETDVLSDRTVTIIGLGTGGSLAAVELAKCAVGKFRLIDFDRLETHNVVRHACGVRDLGRLKTEAVKDEILNFNPFATVECHDVDVLSPASNLVDLVSGSDMVLVCTDSERSKYEINRCLISLWFERQISIPAIYAGAYERAFGGDIMRVIPGESPCYDCVIGSVQQLPFMETMPKSAVPYSALENSEGFRAQPGLGLDVHFIALIQAKLALMTLLRGTHTVLSDIPYNFLFWGNRKEWIFPEPFKCIFARTESRSDCSTCGDGVRGAFGSDRADLLRQSEEIVRAADVAQDAAPEVSNIIEVELPHELKDYKI